MSTPFLLQMTLLTGPPLETQFRVCDVRLWDSDALRKPVNYKDLTKHVAQDLIRPTFNGPGIHSNVDIPGTVTGIRY